MLISRSDLHAVQLNLAKSLEGEKEGPRLTVGTVQYFRVIASISDSGIYHIRDHNHQAIVDASSLVFTNQI